MLVSKCVCVAARQLPHALSNGGHPEPGNSWVLAIQLSYKHCECITCIECVCLWVCMCVYVCVYVCRCVRVCVRVCVFMSESVSIYDQKEWINLILFRGELAVCVWREKEREKTIGSLCYLNFVCIYMFAGFLNGDLSMLWLTWASVWPRECGLG